MTDYNSDDLIGGYCLNHDTPVLEIIYDEMITYPNGDRVPGL